jgi:CheY-like chemotaxis protein
MPLTSKVNILLVDDHPENLIALEAILDGLGQNLVKASSGEETLRRLLLQDFAVILLDVQMPGMDGFETASLIRQRERSRNTPIIFLTAFSNNDNFIFKGYALGAVDYLLKPLDPVILSSKVAVFVDLFKKTTEVQRQAAELAAINAELRQSEERFRCLSASAPLRLPQQASAFKSRL